MSKIRYYNIEIDVLNTTETLSRCLGFINSNSNNLIFFINAHCFNIAQKNSEYKSALNTADLLLNDGIGIKIGAKISGIKIKENMNGTDLVPKILEFAKDHSKNVYFLGGMEGIASAAKQKTEFLFSGISIVKARNGYFDFNDDQEVINDIIKNKTDILIVGMGVPRQELWLTKNKDKLTGVKISIAGGAILDFISEKVVRAPKWMQKTGTEWIFRLIQEPARLFKRYAIGIPLFYYHIMRLKP
jgi:N-acetylglucosaminyldiphosphoundecaprenol N-acetyl-beta-D-mannosaminyltransferase